MASMCVVRHERGSSAVVTHLLILLVSPVTGYAWCRSADGRKAGIGGIAPGASIALFEFPLSKGSPGSGVAHMMWQGHRSLILSAVF